MVFLEVSYLSQFLALALICELTLFRRLVPITILAAGQLLTLAGTGLIVLMLTFPFLLGRLDRRLIAGGIALCIALTAVGTASGWLNAISQRTNEFSDPNSSGYARYTASVLQIADSLSDPKSLVTGVGPGNVARGNINSLPVTKLTSEYGLLTALAFFVFFSISLFSGSRNLPLAVGLFWFFHLGGGSLSMPICVLMCVLLATAMPRNKKSLERQDYP